MKKIINKFLNYCDNHHFRMLIVNLIIFGLATLLLFCFNDNDSLGFSVFVTIFPLIIIIASYIQSKISNDGLRRIYTFLSLLYITVSINLLFAYSWFSFVENPSGIEAFFFIIPMIIFAIIFGIKVLPVAMKKVKNDFDLYIKYFIKK